MAASPKRGRGKRQGGNCSVLPNHQHPAKTLTSGALALWTAWIFLNLLRAHDVLESLEEHPRRQLGGSDMTTTTTTTKDHPLVLLGQEQHLLPALPQRRQNKRRKGASLTSHNNIGKMDGPAHQKGDRHPPQNNNNDQNTKYLTFINPAGFSNQFLGLYRAAQLAHSTGRTLVLPPVLPHMVETENDQGPFADWHALNLGDTAWHCASLRQRDVYQDDFQHQVALAAQPNVPFPSYAGVIDLEAIRAHIPGLEVIDFPDFVKNVLQHNNQNHENVNKWSIGKHPETDYNGECSGGKKRAYADMVQLFQDNFGNDKIAYIGKAFEIRNVFSSYNKTTDALFQEYLYNFILSPKLQCLVSYLKSKLPPIYAGMHIRFNDFATLSQCHEDASILGLYDRAFDDLEKEVAERRRMQGIVENKRQETTITVLLGLSHNRVRKCFRKYVSLRRKYKHRQPLAFDYDAITVNDLMDDTAIGMAAQIDVDPETLDLILDQVLIGQATAGLGMSSLRRSTFQQFIRERQKYWQKEQGGKSRARKWPWQQLRHAPFDKTCYNSLFAQHSSPRV